MPKDMPADIHVKAVAGHPVELPGGNFIADAVMTRSGQDLHLTADGHTVVVQGYFDMANPPELTTHDGAHLSPAMVDSFVQPDHPGQYASSGQIQNDASPAGTIIQVVGHDEVIRADGTHITAAAGMPLYQGDVVETSKTGALNILFSDHTTFAVSENARMSIDKYIYNSEHHTGSTFFSMLQGMFVYTSGLIGKTEPGNVNIETPVGSIGIRGTVIAGHILPTGQPSDITIVNGAIAVTNGAGTVNMSNSFQTIALTSYNAQPQPVAMDASTFGSTYNSLSTVAADTLHHFVSTVPQSTITPTTFPVTAPIMTSPTSTTTHTTTTTTSTVQPLMTTDTTLLTSISPTTTTTSTTTASFGTTSTASFGTTSGTASFSSPTTSTTTTMSTYASSSTSSTSPTTTTTSSTTTPAAPPPPFSVQLTHDTGYSGADHITMDATLLATNLASNAATVTYTVEAGSTWVNNGTTVWTGSANAGVSVNPTATLATAAIAGTTYTVEVQQYDSHSKLISTSAPMTFTLDQAHPSMTAQVTGPQTMTGNTAFINQQYSVVMHFNEQIAPSTFTATNTYTNQIPGVAAATAIHVDSIVYSGSDNYTVTFHATSTGGMLEAITAQDLAGNILTSNTYNTMQTPMSIQDFALTWAPNFTKGTSIFTDDGASNFLQNSTSLGKIQVAPGITVDHYVVQVQGTYSDYNASTGVIQTGLTDTGNQVFGINAAGQLVVNNYLALSSVLNSTGFNINITAYATSGTSQPIETVQHVVPLPDILPSTVTAVTNAQANTGNMSGTFLISQNTTAPTNSSLDVTLSGTNVSGNVLVGGSGNEHLIGLGGQDVLLGEGGNDILQVLGSGFQAVDGGTGVNTLDIGGTNAVASYTNTGFNVNTTSATTPELVKIHNIANITLDTSITGGGNGITLNNTSVFGMANDGAGNHILNISGIGNEVGNIVQIQQDTNTSSVTDLHLTSGIWGVSQNLTYSGIYTDSNGVNQNVTLNVKEFANAGDSFTSANAVLTLDTSHSAPVYGSSAPFFANANAECMIAGSSTMLMSDNNGSATNFHGDIFIGNGGLAGIEITNANFAYIDGGASGTSNHLTLGTMYLPQFSLDFTNPSIGPVKNIENIDLGTSSSGNGNSVTLNVQDVFNMTGSSHTLTISESQTSELGATANVVTTSGVTADNFHYISGAAGGTITYAGTYNTQSVTLIIQDTHAAAGAGHITVNTVA